MTTRLLANVQALFAGDLTGWLLLVLAVALIGAFLVGGIWYLREVRDWRRYRAGQVPRAAGLKCLRRKVG